MNLVSVFHNRYNVVREIYKVNRRTYHLKGKSYFGRMIGDKAYDLEGGPCIYVGDKLSSLGIKSSRKILSIKWISCTKGIMTLELKTT